jgi:hypothetical protein
MRREEMARGALGTESKKIVMADSRGRIVLGSKAKAQAFSIKQAANGDYILTPMVHVPQREAWLWYENESRASFERGLADIQAGRMKQVDYTQYLTPEELADTDEIDTL